MHTPRHGTKLHVGWCASAVAVCSAYPQPRCTRDAFLSSTKTVMTPSVTARSATLACAFSARCPSVSSIHAKAASTSLPECSSACLVSKEERGEHSPTGKQLDMVYEDKCSTAHAIVTANAVEPLGVEECGGWRSIGCKNDVRFSLPADLHWQASFSTHRLQNKRHATTQQRNRHNRRNRRNIRVG